MPSHRKNDVNKSQNTLRVAVIQMVSSFVLEDNLNQAEKLIVEACKQDALLIVLPENCFMFSASDFLSLAEQEDKQGIVSGFLSSLAKKHACYIVAGSVPLLAHEDGKVFSAALVFSPDGEQVARYDKVHLFDVDVDDDVGSYRESRQIKPGSEVVNFSINGIKIGLSICYDLRFPELYRLLSAAACEVLLVPSAFTFATGEKHWEVLLRARAIENQCYVLAPNQGGEHESRSGRVRSTYGHSMIVDDQGKVMNSLSLGEGFIVETLDLESLRANRKAMPVLAHRQLLKDLDKSD